MTTPNDEHTEVPVEVPEEDHPEIPAEDQAEDASEIPVGTVLLEVTSILTSFDFDEVNLGPAYPPRNGYGTLGTPVSLYAVRKPRKKKKKKTKTKGIVLDAPSKDPETKPPPPDNDGAGTTGGVTVY
jgi:hypothetical protein